MEKGGRETVFAWQGEKAKLVARSPVYVGERKGGLKRGLGG